MTAHAADPRIPVTLLTGFLGSGKTTVLNRLLRQPQWRDTAVIVNEFGAIALDHLLVEHTDEHLRILNSGCLCCTVRGDLVDTLADLHRRRADGRVPHFARVVIETTGLADPAPVLHTLMADPAVTAGYRLGSVVTMVDAVNGAATLDRHPEALAQVAMADRLLLTKTDLAASHAGTPLRERLRQLNPCATVAAVTPDPASLADLLAADRNDPLRPQADRMHWPATEPLAAQQPAIGGHNARIHAHCFVIDEPVDEVAFSHWLDLMAAMRGERMLRVKGLVRLAGQPDTPLVVHGVQHVFHPPQRLRAWPSADHRTRLVFITRDLDFDDIARTLHAFTGVRPVRTLPFLSHGAFHHD